MVEYQLNYLAPMSVRPELYDMAPPPGVSGRNTRDDRRFRPEHRWYYYRAMQSNEALLLKCYDSDVPRARFTARSAIGDPTSPADAAPRESIEVRTLAFYA